MKRNILLTVMKKTRQIISILLYALCIFTMNAQITVQYALSRINFSSLPYEFCKKLNFDEYFTAENPGNVIPDKMYENFQLTEYYLARDMPDVFTVICKKFNLGNGVRLGLVDISAGAEWEAFSLITVTDGGSIIDTLEVGVMSGLIMPKQFKINDNREVFVYRLVPESKASINMSSFNYVEAHVTETIYTIDMAGQFILTTPEKRVSSTRTYSKEELESDTFNLWDQY